jgi:hypothetical protein
MELTLKGLNLIYSTMTPYVTCVWNEISYISQNKSTRLKDIRCTGSTYSQETLKILARAPQSGQILPIGDNEEVLQQKHLQINQKTTTMKKENSILGQTLAENRSKLPVCHVQRRYF